MSDSTSPIPTSVYLYYDKSGVLIYVGVTSRGTRRQSEHNAGKEWWPFVARQQVEHYDDRPGALTRERDLISRHLPPFNRHHNPAHEACRAAYMAFRDLAGDDPMAWRDAARAMQQRLELDWHSYEGHPVLRTRVDDMVLASVMRLPDNDARVFGTATNGVHHVTQVEMRGPIALIHLSTQSTHPIQDAYANLKFAERQDGLVLRNVHVRLDHSDPSGCNKWCRRQAASRPKREVRWVRPDGEGRASI